jgi:hypothetical protein
MMFASFHAIISRLVQLVIKSWGEPRGGEVIQDAQRAVPWAEVAGHARSLRSREASTGRDRAL